MLKFNVSAIPFKYKTLGFNLLPAYYIYYTNNSTAYYVIIPSGKTISEMLDEMLISSTNTTDSVIKTAIDNWYASNMTSYTSKLEDTPYCNDRTIYQLNGWNPNGGDTTKYLYLGAYGRTQSPYTPSLTCNINDAFTLPGNLQGNGKLTYPVGLLTADEIRLGGGRRSSNNSSYYLYTAGNYDGYWWSGSPTYFYQRIAHEFYVDGVGNLDIYSVYNTRGVRPAVSLKPGTKFSSGDGSYTDPYVVDMDDTTSSSGTQSSSLPSWNFESQDQMRDWTVIDADGDGYNWEYSFNVGSEEHYLSSYSYILNVDAINANNYAVTPEISLVGYQNVYIDFYVQSANSDYLDSFEVLYGSTNNPSQMTTAINLQEAPYGTWQKYTIDLSQYNGSSVYVAFHHYDSDKMALSLDNIQVHGDYVGS